LSDIQHVYPLIHNKVTSPHYVTPTLRRGRLLDWLHAVSTCRAVVIAADAGYGKTTLLWQWEREVNFPCYWYKLDRNDRDWSLHISYLVESIAQRHPGFGRRAHSMLEQLGGPGSSRPGVAAYLLAEMYEKLTEPCTFIIDDWQFVASVTEVRGLWNQILRDAPPTCRFIFLSRAKPQLQFARFKTHGGYGEMRTDALRFTDREIDELFRDIYNDPLDSTDVAELERRTEGWAASLQLVEVSLRERSSDERRAFIQSITAETDSDLVEFLAQEVLDQQSPATRTFLLSTAVLRQIHPELAASLSGVHDGAKVLRELEDGGLFTFRLDDRSGTYRYHGLFRDFLLRRLTLERSDGEVAALHIHAASYFETHSLWPDAIHHYMAAGLQPQAARLIAKYGEDLVSTGRLPLVEEWLNNWPPKAIRENARLSLLFGEISGLAGRWDEALGLLLRARSYFRRKGDRRMEAVACSKLSTVYNNRGDVPSASLLAQEGLELAPEDAFATRIRLRGNLAVTKGWLESLQAAMHECKRIALESTERGYEQFAAIAHHNLGLMLRYAGDLDESLANLMRAAKFWDASPTNPFADGSELVLTLLALGREDEARAVADAAVRRTRPWPRALADARYGSAAIEAQLGQFEEAVKTLRDIAELGDLLGPMLEKELALLIQCLYLSGGGADEIRSIANQLETCRTDLRLVPTTEVALAFAAHRGGACDGHCARALDALNGAKEIGATYIAAVGEMAIAVLGLDHDPDEALVRVSKLVHEGPCQTDRSSRWLLRRLSPFITRSTDVLGGPELIVKLLELDAEFWMEHAVSLVSLLRGRDRSQLLSAIDNAANESTALLLSGVDGADAQELRRAIVQRFAPRLCIRSFGPLALHLGSWDSAATVIGRRRTRLLLGLLVAHFDAALTRDQVLEFLWPEADPNAAVNSLNQTVFQLRRLIEPSYREGESPQYVVSNLDTVRLNPELVDTDLRRIRELGRMLEDRYDDQVRSLAIPALIDLVRGEYLADVKYEDWVGTAQLGVHAEVRSVLLPIATGDAAGEDKDWTLQAGCALAVLDPFDEAAHVAMIRHLAATGRRGQARTLATSFAARLREELDEEPSTELLVAAQMAGAPLQSISP
jgi:ATP/maltotriose-dependent transcriptional regulator MalT/DNA-binding SARP family transcriptional activator